MAHNFLPVGRNQRFPLAVDMTERLPRDHFAHFPVEWVEEMDTTPFRADYRADGHSGAAHQPAMTAILLSYAYLASRRSSRWIEERCRTDAAHRFVTGGLVTGGLIPGQHPGHRFASGPGPRSTVAWFRDRHETGTRRNSPACSSPSSQRRWPWPPGSSARNA